MTEKQTITVHIGEDEQEMPARYVVCSSCDGRGTTTLHGAAITASEWAEWDQDDRDNYMSGVYDTACPSCKGQRVVLVPDRKRATRAQLKAYSEAQEDDHADRTERMWEDRMLHGLNGLYG
jgi:DnaJ-class molecular chaperone